MGAQAVDYRISRVVVCCKDCGQDVGLYPARHKCQEVIRPPLPPLPANLDDHYGLRVPARTSDNVTRSRSTSSSSSTLNTPSDTSSTTTTGSKWTARFGRSPSTKNNTNDPDNEEESVYFNNFAAHLPEGGDSPGSGQSGKKLWGKVRQNEKWKQLSEKYDKPKQSAKLWGKLVQATQTVADKMPARDDRGPESDESDWEGESHVSRILREYYEKKHEPLPHWLFDERNPRPVSSRKSHEPMRHEEIGNHPATRRPTTGRKQRLWEVNDEPQMTQREREREELRKQRPVYNNNNNEPPPSMDEERGRFRRQYSDESSSSRYSTRSRYDDYPSPSSGRGGSRYSGYDADTDAPPSSSYYRSERPTPPSMRSRSPARYYGDDTLDAYGASNRYAVSPKGHSMRSPPTSRYSERAGYF
ncbi:hypothetical protein RO3G_07476 [Lichtheimia corymbifera JMRC:FSU:9682]|uniref:Mso1 N-terminal domain-containing protein n=1 Tax=Lichtheimia corymbifera JMRC:FSU:9682 TaxID=1263082 RepID=A0A068S6S0_9FUNG|nr:hypothetical protein RO3G_07476 [Lichtheimia corymbifera JMRC:FSU:9682]